jgi:hypothetical protein
MKEPAQRKRTAQQDVKALTKKLEHWGETLPAEERELLEYVLQRASGVVLSEAALPEGGTKIANLVETVYVPRVAGAKPPKPWVKVGKGWVKKK